MFGLRFPSNTDSPAGAAVAFRLTGANALSAYPATYVWQVKYRQQNIQVSAGNSRYFTLFFYANTDLTGFVASGYYGAHPYPNPAPDGTPPLWEISTDGVDTTGPTVSFGTIYTQSLVVRLVNTDELEFKFYYNLPTLASVITYTTTSNWATTFPPTGTPGVVFGEAPWSVDAERMSGTLGPVKIFNTNLSEADIAAEAANMSAIATAAGATNRWWFKPTFDNADDLADAVTGKSAVWYNTNKATRELFV